MLRIVEESDGDLALACEALVDEANERGGEDNITVVLARLTGDDLPSPDTGRITVEVPEHDGDDTIGHEEDATQRL
jgi:serine/threonine protein phosphatase PrpC